MKTMFRRPMLAVAILAVVAMASAGCTGTSSSGGHSGGGTPIHGGTASYAVLSAGPNYVFPLDNTTNFTQTNISYLQLLLYRPLYWYGQGGSSQINYDLSIGQPPLYSDGGKVVTIKLNHYLWSDGTPVTARDVVFWQNLVMANKAEWGAYTPGNYPDNIVSTKIVDPSTIQFTLDKAYDQSWFTYNELSQITPLPQQSWDRTSSSSPDGDYDMTAAGAVQVYRYLDGQSKDLGTYASNPLWKVVDGPWEMSSYTPSDGAVDFSPNPDYSGPQKPYLSKFEEQVFATAGAEFKDLTSGSGPQVGYISPAEISSQPILQRLGYSLARAYSFSISYTQLNFNNPTAGDLFKQTYIRQVLQMLVNEQGLVNGYFGGFGYPTCGPVPAEPVNPFVDSYVKTCPYAYNPAKAIDVLEAHGWNVVPGAVSTCARPGVAANECGAGIKAGQGLEFAYLYGSGDTAFPEAMAQQKSDAEAAGVDFTLVREPGSQLSGAVIPCMSSQAACSWQMAIGGWIYAPDYYPTGETLFSTGGGYNVGSYSDPQADKLIDGTTAAGDPQQTLDAYQDYLAQQEPVIWQPGTYGLNEVSSKLRGVTPFNVFGNINPEDWYYTK
jgi:peptide/nickel transport system substrate-binding protein